MNFVSWLAGLSCDVLIFPFLGKTILSYERHVSSLQEEDLTALMNGLIRRKLRIIPENVTWGGQSAEVFDALEADFMEPATNDGN